MTCYDLDEFAEAAEYVDTFDDPEEAGRALAATLAKPDAALAAFADFERRAAGLLKWEANLRAEDEAIAAELRRLGDRLRAVRARRQGLRDYLRACLLTAGRRKVRTPVGTASLSPGRESVVVDATQIYSWPADVFAAVCEEQPPKVRKDELRKLPPEVVRELAGVSIEAGEDVLTIR